MRTIWKYAIAERKRALEMPYAWAAIHCGKDPSGTRCVWVEVDYQVKQYDEHPYPTERVVFHTIGTGHTIQEDTWEHVGTFIEGAYVWHVYAERLDDPQKMADRYSDWCHAVNHLDRDLERLDEMANWEPL